MATVRYFAAAAEAAGTESERVAADDLGSLKARLVDLHGAELARVLSRSSVLHEGQYVSDPSLPIAHDAVVESLRDHVFWRRNYQIIVPMILPIVAIGLIFGIVFTFTDLSIVFLMTMCGPIGATSVLGFAGFQTGITSGDVGGLAGGSMPDDFSPYATVNVLFQF